MLHASMPLPGMLKIPLSPIQVPPTFSCRKHLSFADVAAGAGAAVSHYF